MPGTGTKTTDIFLGTTRGVRKRLQPTSQRTVNTPDVLRALKNEGKDDQKLNRKMGKS